MPRPRLPILTLAVSLGTSAALAQTNPDQARSAGPRDDSRAASSASARAPHVTPSPQPSTGSLMKDAMRPVADPTQSTLQSALSSYSFFAVPEPEPKVFRRHDLVTVIIREQSEFSSQGSTDLSKEAEMQARLEEFVKLQLSNLEVQGGAIGSSAPSIRASGSRSFKGDATVDRQDSFTARITAEIVDVKPNGTLVLQSRKRIRTDDEEQQFILTGICRAEDITADNTVLSTQLYDFEVSKSHKGAVRDTTKRGWIPKLLDVLNPF